jgi:hypothetical protein
MTKIRFTFGILWLLLAHGGVAQVSEMLAMRKSNIYRNNYLLKPSQVLKLMEPYPVPYQEMRSAKSNADAANVISFIGGGLIGWSLGGLIGGGDFNWGLAGAGAALCVVSVPFYTGYLKKAQSAIGLYNKNFTGAASIPQHWEFGLSGTGPVLLVRF